MGTTTPIRHVAAIAAATVLFAACGGGSDDASEPADEPAEASQPADEPADESTPADDDSAAPADDDAASDDEVSSGTFEPGGVSFRSVNLLDRPVDIYVRTTGLIEAFPVEAGVAAGAVTAYAAPPEGGSYIVTEAGAGDPTCVTGCDHFVAELSGVFGEGPTRTVLLYDDPFSGARAFDLSEEPDSVESAAASGNLLRPADPATGTVFPVGIALDEDQFGFRVGFEGVEGCVGAIDQDNILVGGNQTPAYPYPGDSAGLLFFEQPDQECAEPVSAAIPIDGGPGTRTLVVLQGSAATLQSTVVELSGSVAADRAAGGSDEAGGDTDESAGGTDDIPTDRAGFVEALLEEAPPEIDRQCVTDLVDQMTDEDIQIIVENIDAAELPPGISPEGQAALAAIFSC